MNDLRGIPCVLMRSGTSNRLFPLIKDLLQAVAAREGIPMVALGAGHPLQITDVREQRSLALDPLKEIEPAVPA